MVLHNQRDSLRALLCTIWFRTLCGTETGIEYIDLAVVIDIPWVAWRGDGIARRRDGLDIVPIHVAIPINVTDLERCRIASIPKPIAIAIPLVRVKDRRTIIVRICDTIGIRIGCRLYVDRGHLP